MVTPGAKRDAVAHARNCHGLSERRACHLIGIARRVARYEPRVADDTGLRQRLRELAAARRRFGYRRLGYLLAREGLKPNHKKLLRLYREEGLKVRRRGGRNGRRGPRRKWRCLKGRTSAGHWILSLTPLAVVDVSAFCAWWMISRAQALCLANVHPAILALPIVNGRAAAPLLATHIGNGNPSLVLLKNADNLIVNEPAAFHLWSFQLGKDLPQTRLAAAGKVPLLRYQPQPTRPVSTCYVASARGACQAL